MSSYGYEYSDEIIVRRRNAPGSVDRNRNKSSRVKIAAPEPTHAQFNPTSAPTTPLKSNKSPTLRTSSLVDVKSNPSKQKIRNLSMSPTLKKKSNTNRDLLYDEPADLAVPSTMNLPPVRSSSAVDKGKSLGRITPVRKSSPAEIRQTPPIEEFPPIPNDVVDYSEVSPEDFSPIKEHAPTEFPPMPDNLIIMAVEGC